MSDTDRADDPDPMEHLMRRTVADFVDLGPLPGEDGEPAQVAEHQRLLESITPPVTEAEASALLQCFGQDECFGLAWALVHLIETSPSPIPDSPPSPTESIWLHVLHARQSPEA